MIKIYVNKYTHRYDQKIITHQCSASVHIQTYPIKLSIYKNYYFNLYRSLNNYIVIFFVISQSVIHIKIFFYKLYLQTKKEKEKKANVKGTIQEGIKKKTRI